MKPGGRHGFGHRGGGGGDIAQTLAKLSGKSESTIMSCRASGKSFAQIADAEGVGTDELLAETARLETAELDAAVKAGQMTAAERTQELSGLQATLQAELTETQTFGHGGHGFGHDGDGLQGSTGSGTSTGASSSTTGPASRRLLERDDADVLRQSPARLSRSPDNGRRLHAGAAPRVPAPLSTDRRGPISQSG